MITGIHHVQVTIPKGAEAEGRQFYCGVLGLGEIPKPEALKPHGGFWVQAGDLQVHVGTEDGVERQRSKAHVAYAVTDLDAWRERLSAAGIAIEANVPLPGMARFEFRDPFGNRVEMLQLLG